jgi:hypothetical protein
VIKRQRSHGRREGQDQRSAAPFVSLDTQVVERTEHSLPSLLKDVHVDHGR